MAACHFMDFTNHTKLWYLIAQINISYSTLNPSHFSRLRARFASVFWAKTPLERDRSYKDGEQLKAGCIRRLL